jgi:hypothetical protein
MVRLGMTVLRDESCISIDATCCFKACRQWQRRNARFRNSSDSRKHLSHSPCGHVVTSRYRNQCSHLHRLYYFPKWLAEALVVRPELPPTTRSSPASSVPHQLQLFVHLPRSQLRIPAPGRPAPEQNLPERPAPRPHALGRPSATTISTAKQHPNSQNTGAGERTTKTLLRHSPAAQGELSQRNPH